MRPPPREPAVRAGPRCRHVDRAWLRPRGAVHGVDVPVVEDDNVERALGQEFDGIEEGRVAGLRAGGGRSEDGREENSCQQY